MHVRGRHEGHEVHSFPRDDAGAEHVRVLPQGPLGPPAQSTRPYTLQPVVHYVFSWRRVTPQPVSIVLQPRLDTLRAEVLSGVAGELTAFCVARVVDGNAVMRARPPRAAAAQADC